MQWEHLGSTSLILASYLASFMIFMVNLQELLQCQPVQIHVLVLAFVAVPM